MARRQGARSLELRAAMSLAGFEETEREGHELVAEVYGAFTEGFATRDLKRAETLFESRQSL